MYHTEFVVGDVSLVVMMLDLYTVEVIRLILSSRNNPKESVTV